MKIRIIAWCDCERVEKEVNEFLRKETKKLIDIKYSMSTSSADDVLYSAMIIYK